MHSIHAASSRGLIVAMLALTLALSGGAPAMGQSAGDQFSKRVGDWFRRNLYGEVSPGYGPPSGSIFNRSPQQAAPQSYYRSAPAPATQRVAAPIRQSAAPVRAPSSSAQYATPQSPHYEQAPIQHATGKAVTSANKVPGKVAAKTPGKTIASTAKAKSGTAGKKRSYSPPRVREEEPVSSYEDKVPLKQTVVTAPSLVAADAKTHAPVVKTSSPEASRSAAINASFTGGAPYANGSHLEQSVATSKSASGSEVQTTPPVPAPPAVAKSETTPAKPKAAAGGYPVGTSTGKAGRVVSPYPPNTELDVAGMASGSLALDPITNQVFQVP
jgi:hypothetical protein